MDNYEFYEVIHANSNLFIGLLIMSVGLHYLIFRNIVSTFLDPYFLGIISSVFGFADVILLYVTGEISTYVLSSYLFTQTFFWLGLFTFKTLKDYKNLLNPEYKIYSYKSPSFEKNFAFYFFSFVFLASQLTIYYLKGIPLFMVSRLETFADGAGEGVLGRIADVTSIFILYHFFDSLDFSKSKLTEFPKLVVITLVFIAFLLSGSKSTFLVIFIVLWSQMVYSRINGVDYSFYLRTFKAHYGKMIAISLVIVSGIILTQGNREEGAELGINPIFSIGLRFIHSGDIYWYTYPKNIYQIVDSAPGFKALFTDMLGMLRIYSWNDLPDAIGITIKNFHHPSDVVSGPNARHNVFGLIYYGYFGSILFSFALGSTISFVRNVLPKLMSYTALNGFIFCFLATKINTLEGDPMLSLTYLNNLFFIFPALYLINLILTEIFMGIGLKAAATRSIANKTR